MARAKLSVIPLILEWEVPKVSIQKLGRLCLNLLYQVIEREGYFVEPTIITGLPHDSPLVKTECFAPIVYCIEIPDLETGVKYNNEVEQGLSSSLFTENLGDIFKVRNSYTLDREELNNSIFKCLI